MNESITNNYDTTSDLVNPQDEPVNIGTMQVAGATSQSNTTIWIPVNRYGQVNLQRESPLKHLIKSKRVEGYVTSLSFYGIF